MDLSCIEWQDGSDTLATRNSFSHFNKWAVVNFAPCNQQNISFFVPEYSTPTSFVLLFPETGIPF
jgi:hypothetical protein